jgi:hypothetical protein
VLAPAGNGRLALAVHNNWAAVLSAPGLDDVRVALLVSSTSVSQDLFARIARDVREQLPALVGRARDDAGIVAPTPVPATGWGAPAPAGPSGPVGGFPAEGGWGSGSPAPPPAPPAGGGGWGSPPASPPTWGSPPAP